MFIGLITVSTGDSLLLTRFNKQPAIIFTFPCLFVVKYPGVIVPLEKSQLCKSGKA